MNPINPRQRPCVLALDNSKEVRELYQALLSEEGYAVVTLSCEDAGIDAMKQARPDVVLLDCFIGCDPSGWQLLQLLTLDPELRQVPVIVCTTDMQLVRDDAARLEGEGVQVLPKPFDLDELLTAIADAHGRERVGSG